MSSYCAERVKRHDNDRYLCALPAPGAARDGLMALYAFNLEVASIAETVSEPTLGLVRLQWWRDTVEWIYAGGTLDHPVAQVLADAIRRHDLDRAHFVKLLDARALDIEGESFKDMKALEAYAEATSSSLVFLALEVLDVKDDASMKAGRLVGIAWALCGLLRSAPFHAQRRRLYLPRNLQSQWGMVEEALFAGRPCPGFPRVVAEIAAVARARLEEARSLRPQVPKIAIAALLPATLCSGYLNRIQASGFNPFEAAAQKRTLFMLAALGVNAFRGRY